MEKVDAVPRRTRCMFCKAENTMVDVSVPRANPLWRMVGYLLAGPSVLGMVYSIAAMFGDGDILARILHRQLGIQRAAAYINEALDYGIAMFLVFVAAGGVLLSWYLLSFAKLRKCLKCGELL